MNDGPSRTADPQVIDRLGLSSPPSPRRWLWRGAALVLLLGGGAFGVQRYLAQRATQNLPKFETVAAARTRIEVIVTATGTLSGLGTVEVGAEVSGKLLAVHADWNDQVKRGQLLAEIDPEQLRAAVDESSARVRQADASVRQALATQHETTLAAERARSQAAQQLISQAELDAALAAAERADATVQSSRAAATLARATLDSTRSRLEKTRIVSPIDGVVLSRLVEPGQTVTAGFQTPVLFKIAEDLRRMSLHVFIDEADIGRSKQGQSASFTVDAYPGRVFPSKVLELRNEPKLQQNVVTYEAVLEVDNSELLLRPGMTATALIVAGVHEDVLAVSNAALRFSPPQQERGTFGPRPAQQLGVRASGKQHVWVLKDGTPEPVEVVAGATDGRLTEIVSGELAAGTPVIVDVAAESTEKPR